MRDSRYFLGTGSKDALAATVAADAIALQHGRQAMVFLLHGTVKSARAVVDRRATGPYDVFEWLAVTVTAGKWKIPADPNERDDVMHSESRRAEMESLEIKRFLKERGASVVGVAPVGRFVDAPTGHRPEDLLPRAKSVVVMGVRIPRRVVEWLGILSKSELVPNEQKRSVECGHFYGRCGYETINIRLEQIGLLGTNFMEEKGEDAFFLPATYSHHTPIMEAIPGYYAPFSHRHAAVRAGLGEFGLNNLVLNPRHGCRIRWESIITTADLEPDPLITDPVCLREKCGACLKVCWRAEDNPGVTIHPLKNLPDGIYYEMPSIIDKEACYTTVEAGEQRCWGRCIAVCPVGRHLASLEA